VDQKFKRRKKHHIADECWKTSNIAPSPSSGSHFPIPLENNKWNATRSAFPGIQKRNVCCTDTKETSRLGMHAYKEKYLRASSKHESTCDNNTNEAPAATKPKQNNMVVVGWMRKKGGEYKTAAVGQTPIR